MFDFLNGLSTATKVALAVTAVAGTGYALSSMNDKKKDAQVEGIVDGFGELDIFDAFDKMGE